MELVVRPTGEITTIYSEVMDLAALGAQRIERASQVEPNEQGHWFAQILDGPTLGPFPKRSDAIAAEIAWLVQHRLR